MYVGFRTETHTRRAAESDLFQFLSLGPVRRKNRSSFEHMHQLAHIAGPGCSASFGTGRSAVAASRASPCPIWLRKCFRQAAAGLPSARAARELYRKNRQTDGLEVEPEQPFPCVLLERLMGRGDTRTSTASSRCTHTLQGSPHSGAQHLGLQGQRHLANPSRNNVPSIAPLRPSRLRDCTAPVKAPRVLAEDSASSSVSGDSGRAVSARVKLFEARELEPMQGLRDNLLAPSPSSPSISTVVERGANQPDHPAPLPHTLAPAHNL